MASSFTNNFRVIVLQYASTFRKKTPNYSEAEERNPLSCGKYWAQLTRDFHNSYRTKKAQVT